MEKILVDLGSSTVKVYKLNNNNLEQLLVRSISFKEGFSSEEGLSQTNKKELLELLSEIKNKHKECEIRIYATALCRKLLLGTKCRLIDEIFENTGLYLNIISQELENFYLENALVGKCTLDKPILLLNIGGGSTELVVMYGKEAIEKYNLDLGVGTIITKFESINDPLSKVTIESVKSFTKSALPVLKNKVEIAFYNGGELTYMKIAGYNTSQNNIFKDQNHPQEISIKDFSKRNNEIFSKVSLDELEKLMPQNPKWMHGARACSAIAEAIFENYGIKTIIPSDSNLMHGVVRQGLRYATISGSFRKHLDYILKIRKELMDKGVTVLSPRFTEPKNPGEEFVVFGGEENMTPLALERHHLDSIEKSDALVVCCPQGYVGASALIEIGYANSLGKRIIFTEKPEEFMLNTLPAEIGL